MSVEHQVKRITDFEERRERLLRQLPQEMQLVIQRRQQEAAATPGELHAEQRCNSIAHDV